MPTPFPDRIAQLFRLVLISDKPGECHNAAMALTKTLAGVGIDPYMAVDAFVSSLVAPAEKDDELAWIEVDSYILSRHQKPGGKPGLRVSYKCGTATYFDFWPLQHGGAAREIALGKWSDVGGEMPGPRTVGEAIARIDELADSIEIAVRLNNETGYWDVVGRRLRQEVRA